MKSDDMTATTRHDDESLTGLLRRVLRAQLALHQEVSAHASARVLAARRSDLVGRLTAYRAALDDAHLTVPRTILDELRVQTQLLAPATAGTVGAAEADLDRLADDGAPTSATRPS